MLLKPYWRLIYILNWNWLRSIISKSTMYNVARDLRRLSWQRCLADQTQWTANSWPEILHHTTTSLLLFITSQSQSVTANTKYYGTYIIHILYKMKTCINDVRWKDDMVKCNDAVCPLYGAKNRRWLTKSARQSKLEKVKRLKVLYSC